jgi:hypothetical protein
MVSDEIRLPKQQWRSTGVALNCYLSVRQLRKCGVDRLQLTVQQAATA